MKSKFPMGNISLEAIDNKRSGVEAYELLRGSFQKGEMEG